MPRYRDNQFISNFLKPQDGEKTNAPFIYPRRRVRTYDDRSVREDANVYANRGYRRSTELDRGFMRNLSSPGQTQFGEFKRQRLNFQFNPSDILQSVQMRQDVYLPILQDPSQFAQPMSAVATFNFDLLFDRTMEVGRGASRPQGGTVDVFGDINPVDSVYEIGVLSDLQVLYSIIGQGFSNDFINQQLETIKQLAKAQLLNDGDEGNDTEVASIEASTVESFSGSANLGNNAFLIPMPVRIVFSELFMVDGFVTGTSVRFTKFNTNMVPIQASVGLSMNALYIGFAKEDTFLTVQLENQKKNLDNQRIERIEASREALNAARQSARRFVFVTDDQSSWKEGVSSPNQGIRLSIVGNDNVYGREYKVGFKDAKDQSSRDLDKIEKLFKDGDPLSVSYRWRMEIYGAYSPSEASLAATEAQYKLPSKTMVGLYYNDEVIASDADSWDEIRSDSIRSSENNASGSQIVKNHSDSPIPGIPGNYDLYYFVVHFTASISVGDTVRSVNVWKRVRGQDPFYYEAELDWPAFNNPYPTNDGGGYPANPPRPLTNVLKTGFRPPAR